MMNNDKYRSREYFETYILNQISRIERYEKLADQRAGNDKKPFFSILSGRYKDLISARLSHGDKKDVLVSDFMKYAGCIFQVGFSSYSECVDFYSLAVILGVKDFYIPIPSEYNDDLINILVSYVKDEEPKLHNKLNYRDYYGLFVEYFLGNKSLDDLINYVNDGWYQSSVDFYWFNSHLKNDDVYAGYWCYVASALLIIKHDYEKIDKLVRYFVNISDYV